MIQEAFLHRRPVITSNIGGMAEAVRDGIDGLHVRPDDPVALANTMRSAMETRSFGTTSSPASSPGDVTEIADRHLAAYRGIGRRGEVIQLKATQHEHPPSKNALAVKETEAPSQIQGRLDAIEGRRLFGWVWDRAYPSERLLVRILLEGRMVASATADLARVDLRRNGIGDGGHAFEVELPEALAGVTASLTVVAVSPATGEETVLRSPSQGERAAEAAVSGPFNRVLDRLEILIEAQRRSQLVQREAVETIRATSKQVDEIVRQEDGIGAALELCAPGRRNSPRRSPEWRCFISASTRSWRISTSASRI